MKLFVWYRTSSFRALRYPRGAVRGTERGRVCMMWNRLWGRLVCYVSHCCAWLHSGKNETSELISTFRGLGIMAWRVSELTLRHQGVSKIFRTESITKCTLTTIKTRWGATQRVLVAKLTRLIHKIAIQLHPVAESWTICSSRSRRPFRILLDTSSYCRGLNFV
jgi:hypothetical protein